MQEVIAYSLLIIALFFLVKKYAFPKKKKGNCNTDCGCH
ncbi:FeoB-associated Cys-rich membrane protein [Polaribacter haliotis]|uniref:FeoB-associated Cys-rich membrane protein n=1 Tax=Polaribacter haliotis TaxID=1888915 RepID=A0A7L8ADL0_9FLAO|nr:FeoB-associated Cys-rich membrane protein [Polaribacter haliotis]QOD60100.1 FeoB-associated Cys-rich membrane protein [Polaribacter haliotis]